MTEQRWDRRTARLRDRERDRLLREWLRAEVLPFSAFWAERLGAVEIARAADLESVPVADEDELAPAGGPGNPALLVLPSEEQFKRHIGRRELQAAARELRGTGAQGRQLVLFRRYKPVHVHEAGVARLLTVAYTRTDLDRLHLAGARLMEVLDVSVYDTFVNGVPMGPSLEFWGLYHAALATRMTAVHPRSAGCSPSAALARSFAVLPPTVLALPVAEAPALLTGLAREGIRAEQLRTVLAVGPPPTAAVRAEIAQAAARLGPADVRVQAVWAPSSARVLWGECRAREADPIEAAYGLHTYPDLEVLEVRDVFGGATVGEQTPGELLYTSMGWRGTVVVRAATGAWTGGLVSSRACPNCGRTVPRLSPEVVESAWQPRVATDDGLTHVDLRAAASALRPDRLEGLGVRDWSLRAVDGGLVLGLDVAGENRRNAVAELAHAVGEAVGVVPEVRLGASAAAARPQLGDAGPPAGQQASPGASG